MRHLTALKEALVRIIPVLLAVAWSGSAAAGYPAFGTSLGILFPADRLTARSDELGSSLYPGPEAAVSGVLGPLDALPMVSWECSAAFALFQSSEDRHLRLTYVPLQVAGVWEAGRPGGLSLQLRAGAGPAFISANTGGARSLALLSGGVAGRLVAGLKDLDCAMEAGVELLAKGRLESLLRLRISIFTR